MVGKPAEAKQTKPGLSKRRLAVLSAGIVAFIVLAASAGYFLGVSRTAIVAPPAASPAEPARLSIVVLPFTNLSNDPNQDYFADGITENLTIELSRIRNSFVIARNTAFSFKGKNVDAREIGRELGVRYVLEGSVQRDGTRVRVNAQLIDAGSGAHLWADRFEEDVADLFKLQDQVVARLRAFGGVDVLVNNAGIMELAPLADTDDAMFDRRIAINLKGVFNGLREAGRRLRDGGRVVNLSTSVVGTYFAIYGAYAASKSGVEALTRVFAKEVGARGITVNAVAPGSVETNLFMSGKTEAQIEAARARSPLGRLGQSEDIAGVVSFLVGPDGGWVNGQVVRANGGAI